MIFFFEIFQNFQNFQKFQVREKSLHTPRGPESWRLGYQSVVLERSEQVLILAAVEGVSFLLILYWGSMIFSEQILSVTSTRFSIVALTENRPMVGMKTSKIIKNNFFKLVRESFLNIPSAHWDLGNTSKHVFHIAFDPNLSDLRSQIPTKCQKLWKFWKTTFFQKDVCFSNRIVFPKSWFVFLNCRHFWCLTRIIRKTLSVTSMKRAYHDICDGGFVKPTSLDFVDTNRIDSRDY